MTSLKNIFEQIKALEPVEGAFGCQDTLLEEDFEPEQIWGQIQFLNNAVFRYLKRAANPFVPPVADQQSELSQEGEEEEEVEEDEDELDPDEELSDNDFDDEELDVSDDAEEANYMFDDFFGSAPQEEEEEEQDGIPLEDQVADLFAEEENEQDVEFNDENKSQFEKTQDLIRKQIKELELESIKEKEWTLTGEVSSKQRPKNSLLEEYIDFQNVSKPVPIISQEYTKNLDDLIRERIEKEEFDDVVLKVNLEQKFKVKDVISDEKSKKSLAELYEDEYMNVSRTSKLTQELNNQHEEIKKMEKDLYHKLDSLTNFFYTPKLLNDEQKVLNVPAIMMEDVIPTNVADTMMKAPHEIMKPKNLKSNAELTKPEKNTLRRKRKQQRKDNPQKKSKLNDIEKLLKNPNVKIN